MIDEAPPPALFSEPSVVETFSVGEKVCVQPNIESIDPKEQNEPVWTGIVTLTHSIDGPDGKIIISYTIKSDDHSKRTDNVMSYRVASCPQQ